MLDTVFKAYDIRGIYPNDLTDDDVLKTIRAYVSWLKPAKVAVGRDVRQSGDKLQKIVTETLLGMGVDVVDIGVVTTDMLYFAVANYNLDGGVDITASHNPSEYNGLKLVGKGAKPISGDSGLAKIKELAKKNKFDGTLDAATGKIEEKNILDDYLKKILAFVDITQIKPMKVVVNPNYGAAGKVIDRIARELKLELIKLNFEENGRFPKGRPDPMEPTVQKETSEAVRKTKADFGVAWDADADRCFFFDETGEFIPGYYATAILTKIMLKNNRHSVIIHDPRLVWAVRDVIAEESGVSLVNKVGHSFIKERMRKEDAIFAGENSGHYYFRDFYYSDNGMIPFLLMLQYLSESEQKLSEIAAPYFEKYPISGELNFKVKDKQKVLDELKEKYKDGEFDETDGVSITYEDWRFNARASNTEPLLRLNIEAMDKKILGLKVTELTGLIEQ